ncbi:assimilatory sulfite reductase (NADPH) flavoprotein subunit [Hymenobacter sp. BT491]|uniref:assimilatory sulfite reductase (NADPH) flavoprotein subunit n=1 Tax=Hymenobacter sp. BT491 TaxID=2766779 RepID=UPI001653E136|nr:assimilatory sulfite reductase (NADPH) flavoprotein subunit [Hymenobacter sp. BT491]MBC6989754.1 assimilatory sulfite reductase (NADPH) flavoprotein subunit [Hymenobacter sp. BT491]
MSLSQGPTLPIGFDEATLQQFSGGLNTQQLLWLSGYFYGRYAAGTGEVAPQAAPTTASASATSVTILFGSQTGNSQKVAKLAAEAARKRGLLVEVKDMNEYAPRALVQERLLLVVVSTQGEGDPPIAAEEVRTFLLGKRAPQLPDLRYSVLALGDKSYLQFCQTGKEFDQRLAELGAQRLLERVDCDVDYHTAAEQWIEAVLEKITGATTTSSPATSTANAIVKPEPVTPVYSRQNPWEARILESIQLNGRGSSKETYHLELDLTGSALHYEPGDALAVLPTNEDPLVEEVLRAARLSDTAPVQLENEALPLAAALASRRELTVLTRDVVERYATLAPYAQLQELLADTQQLRPYLYGRDVADLLTDFPTDITAQTLVETLRPLPSRAYSIASSLLAHPDEVHLTVGALRYDAHGRRKHGACSSFLADRVGLDDSVRVFVERNEYFKLPTDSATDIIMVGAGTGVAPFRAFVEERVELGAAGRNWLLFGNPNFTTDFLYQAEWLQHHKKGALTKLDVAFSRDQAEKRYVQHAILENARDVFGWLENGAHFYVCGNKDRLGSAVQHALTEVVQREAGLDAEGASEYLRALKKQRRYLEDVY